MPNWCSNMLQVSSAGETNSGEQLDSFLAKYGKGFTFSKVKPIPEDFAGVHSGYTTIDGVPFSFWREIVNEAGERKSVGVSEEEVASWKERHGAAGWYDWCNANWGTKWDIEASDFEEVSKGDYQISFDTAWAPPEGVIETLSKEFPALSFSLYYCEPGCSFAGVDVYEDGCLADRNDTGDMEEARGISDWHDNQLSYMDELDEEEV